VHAGRCKRRPPPSPRRTPSSHRGSTSIGTSSTYPTTFRAGCRAHRRQARRTHCTCRSTLSRRPRRQLLRLLMREQARRSRRRPGGQSRRARRRRRSPRRVTISPCVHRSRSSLLILEAPSPSHFAVRRRRQVTELNSVSSYLRGRITQDKVRPAVLDTPAALKAPRACKRAPSSIIMLRTTHRCITDRLRGAQP
jgi:hypothetical protein